VPVTSLTGAFAATNPSVTLTPDGVHFGVYPDASTGGSLAYFGADGLTLAQLTDLSYRFTYKANGEPPHYTAAPYLRIYTDGPDARPLVDDDGDGNPANDQTDVILDPSNCATAPNLDQAAGRFRSLRNKPAGNYNVHIVARYRTKSGKVHIVWSTRNPSVTVA
jgi:hypothetical protein